MTTAMGTHSLAVLGLGLNMAADVSGSLFVAWRLWDELRATQEPERAERVASVAVGFALITLGVFLATEAVAHLLSDYRPHPSAASLAVAVASVVVLTPLGLGARRVGSLLASSALYGGGSLSLFGAAIAGLALVGLVLDAALSWWWADALAALSVAAGAFTEAGRILRGQVV
jgi:divalent metal cation (Fe/Co/Zn/Cd) transporter